METENFSVLKMNPQVFGGEACSQAKHGPVEVSLIKRTTEIQMW